MSSPLTITVSDVPHRDVLVAEIWLEDSQIMEIFLDDGRFVLQTFASGTGAAWQLDVDDVVSVVKEATERLEALGYRPHVAG